MNITICNRDFDADKIKNITINANAKKIFIDTEDDFFNMDYKYEEEITEAQQWLKLQTMTLKDLYDAINIIVSTCTYFINTTNQCAFCPIKRMKGCLFETIPINWKQQATPSN